MWFGLAISNVGVWMQTFGLGWLVVQLAIRDGQPQLGALYLGLLGLARALPGLGIGLIAGVVADRNDRIQLLTRTQIGAAITSASLAALTIADRADILVILLLQAAMSVIFAFEVPARQAMVHQLVPPRDLMSAIGMNSVGFNAATIVGPVIGGLLIGNVGVGGLLAIHAASYCGILVALSFVRSHPSERMSAGTSMLESIREGLAYLRRDPVLSWVVLLAVIVAMFARPYIQLLPAVAQELHLTAIELSWLLAACGVGAVCGAVATASLGSIRRRGVVLVASVVAIGTLCVLLGFQRSLLGALLTLGATSLATQLFLGMVNTMLQTGTPTQLRGRAMSVHAFVMIGLMPLGTMLLGTLGSAIGVLNSFVIGGVLVAAFGAYAARRVVALRGRARTAMSIDTSSGYT